MIFTSLGTKGLLLKMPHQLIREVNRSYYCADAYEYPAVFYQNSQIRTFLIHCPQEYCRLEVEDVETGEAHHLAQKTGSRAICFTPDWRSAPADGI